MAAARGRRTPSAREALLPPAARRGRPTRPRRSPVEPGGRTGAAAENLARVLSAGRLAPDLLMRAPEAVALLGDGDGGGLAPRERAQLEQEILAAVGRAENAQQAVTAARGVRRRELFRTAAADIVGSYGTETQPAEADQGALVDLVGGAVSDQTAATLAGTLRAVVREGWGDTLPTRFAVIGMGRFGGHELGYGSDAA